MDIDIIGKIIRAFIINHNKNRYTLKSDLKKSLSLSTNEINDLIIKSNEYLKNFNLEIKSIDFYKNTDIKNSEKFFIIKNNKNSENIKIDDYRLYSLFSLIEIENNNFNKLDLLKEIKYFKNIDISEYLKSIKNKGYIEKKMIDNEETYSFSWRYYIEYGDIFKIKNYKDIKNE